MGLDWIGFQQTDDDDYIQEMYRGKGVAQDVNFSKQFSKLIDKCYGSQKSPHPEICGCDYIPEEEKQEIIDAIRTLIELPEEEIEFDDSNDTHQEWKDWMEGAISFLEENEYVFCWY